MQDYETIKVDKSRIFCEGPPGGSGGHPRVWLQIDDETGQVACPYCDRRYVLDRDLLTKGQ